MSNSVVIPRVGIGMPVYNGERYLEETLTATLAQTYEDFELIIADNASTDKTEQICKDFASQDSRIRYIRNPINLGASKNYTVCFEPSKSEYFRWANADDLPAPDLIEKCISVLDEHPDTVLAYGKTKIIDENGKLLDHYDDNLDLQHQQAAARFVQCLDNIGLSNILYGLVRRDSLAHTALMGNYIASDINLIAELTLYGKYREIPDYLFSRRMHPDCSSWDRADEERQKNFWDPSKQKLLMQTWRTMFEYFKAVYRAPISASDKQKLTYYLCKKMYRRKGKMMQDLHHMVKYKLNKTQ
ncbi:hypothetical protein A9Q81_11340 [Gammaproteobacteria bacterium 42_54_T18]|nr:hypothetical protein A9Q81_11340 [Gammaproteobacteria bacterium 42_54_T18]